MDTSRIKNVSFKLKKFGRLLLVSIYYWCIKILHNVFSLTGITCICLFVFSVAITWFYYTLATVKMDMWECIYFKDKWRNTILGFGTAAVFVLDLVGIKTHLQKQISYCFKITIVLTYLLVIGVYWAIIDNPYSYFLSLSIGVFTSTGMILISGARHNALID